MRKEATVVETSETSLRNDVHSRGGLLICTAGYEDRALKAASVIGRSQDLQIRVIRLLHGDAANDEAFEKCSQLFGGLMPEEVITYSLNLRCIGNSGVLLGDAIADLLVEKDKSIYVDLSGLPSHGICQVLLAVRLAFPAHSVVCIYTAAEDYYPTEKEFRKSVNSTGKLISKSLPDSLTYEAADNLILNVFSGFSLRQERTCLVLFAGFEKHRSVAAIEGCSPSRLLVIYAKSADLHLSWREDLARQLHADIVPGVEKAEEALLTTQVSDLCDLLKQYYSILYDDMAIVLAPLNSKLHTVACFLFWEFYRDAQICFPLPVRYLPSRSSKGCGLTYTVELPPPPQVSALLGI